MDELDAGEFLPWITDMRAGLRGTRGMDVPCGGCTACCTSSQFVPIGPDETDTLGHIPVELLFPAPWLPPGHVVLGYDEHGRCPMLIDDHCSIYEHRPQSCRAYDCRIFAAAGVDVGEAGKVLVGERAVRWRFRTPTADDRAALEAVRAATRFLAEHLQLVHPTRAAVAAVEISATFLERDEGSGELRVIEPSLEAVRAALDRTRSLPAG